VSPLLFLVPLLPPLAGAPPFEGQRVRWPGEDRELVWDGERWAADEAPDEPPFDGGDAWLDEG
jgi:hypothetical protein